MSGLLCAVAAAAAGAPADAEPRDTGLVAFTRRTYLLAAFPGTADDYALIPFPMLAWLVRQQGLGWLTIDPGGGETEYRLGAGELATLATGALPEAVSDGVTTSSYRNEQVFVSRPPVAVAPEARDRLAGAAAAHPAVLEIYLYETRFWSDLGAIDRRFVEAAPETVVGVYCDPAPRDEAHCQTIVDALRAAVTPAGGSASASGAPPATTASVPLSVLSGVRSYMFLGESELMAAVRERAELLYRRPDGLVSAD